MLVLWGTVIPCTLCKPDFKPISESNFRNLFTLKPDTYAGSNGFLSGITGNIPLYKPHIEGIADLCASAFASRCVNSAEWISVMPRKSDQKSKERYISRLLA